MSIADLLDPEKVKAVEERFRPMNSEDVDKVRKVLKDKGLDIKESTPFIYSPKAKSAFKRSNFGKHY